MKKSHTNIEKMANTLLEVIASYGDRGTVMPFSRVYKLKEEVLDLKHGEFHTTWLDRMVNHITADANDFIPSNMGFEPQSLITIAMPSSKMKLQFSYHGKPVDCFVPPHYAKWNTNNERALQYIKDYLAL